MYGKFCVGAILVAGLTAAAAGSVAARDLTVVSWGGAYQDAQRQAYFEPFVQDTGIPLIEESWDGGIGVLRAKVEGGAANWDVVQVESEELTIGCDEGLFEFLDYDRIGGADAYLDEAVHECGVGTIVYNFVLGYDREVLADAPSGWVDFFDTASYPGKRALRQGPKTTLEIALIGDGVAPKDVYTVLATDAGVERAFAKLDSIRDDLIFWKSGAQPPLFLASGEVVMTSVYNGRIDAANRNEGKNFGMVWTGSLFTLDSWVILRNSPNLDQAYRFLSFAGQPEQQKLLPDFIAYGVSNKRAVDLIDPVRLNDLPILPAHMASSVEIDTDFWIDNIDRLTERFTRWAAR